MVKNNQELENLAAKVIEAKSLLDRAAIVMSDVLKKVNEMLNSKVNEKGEQK